MNCRRSRSRRNGTYIYSEYHTPLVLSGYTSDRGFKAIRKKIVETPRTDPNMREVETTLSAIKGI